MVAFSVERVAGDDISRWFLCVVEVLLVDPKRDVHVALDQGVAGTCLFDSVAKAIVAIGRYICSVAIPNEVFHQFDEPVLEIRANIFFTDLCFGFGTAAGVDSGDRLIEVENVDTVRIGWLHEVGGRAIRARALGLGFVSAPTVL